MVKMNRFGDSVEEVDTAVGVRFRSTLGLFAGQFWLRLRLSAQAVLDEIKRLGLTESTLVLLTSDNGAPGSLGQWSAERGDEEPTALTGINAPFTGTKWQVLRDGPLPLLMLFLPCCVQPCLFQQAYFRG